MKEATAHALDEQRESFEVALSESEAKHQSYWQKARKRIVAMRHEHEEAMEDMRRRLDAAKVKGDQETFAVKEEPENTELAKLRDQVETLQKALKEQGGRCDVEPTATTTTTTTTEDEDSKRVAPMATNDDAAFEDAASQLAQILRERARRSIAEANASLRDVKLILDGRGENDDGVLAQIISDEHAEGQTMAKTMLAECESDIAAAVAQARETKRRLDAKHRKKLDAVAAWLDEASKKVSRKIEQRNVALLKKITGLRAKARAFLHEGGAEGVGVACLAPKKSGTDVQSPRA
eukprot:g3418.t1